MNYFDEYLKTIVSNEQKEKLDEISLEGERWQAIPGFPKHLVSSCGRIYSLHRNRLLSQFRVSKSRKYLGVSLGSPLQSYRNYRVHRLVGEVFLAEDKQLWLEGGWMEHELEIHHKDHNTLNNNVDNLAWMPKKEHMEEHKRKDYLNELY